MIKTGTNLTHSYVEQKEPYAIEFGFLNQEEIIKSSVASIKNERIYDGCNVPTFEGVNDPRMGTMDKDRLCLTCKGTQVDCPGHFGHIELTRPVYHVGLLEYIRKILKLVCFNCGRVLYPRDKDQAEFIRKVRNPKHRFFQINRVSERHAARDCDPASEGCGMKQPKFTRKSLSIIVEYSSDSQSYMQNLGFTSLEQKEPVQPEDAYRVLSMMSAEDQHLLGVKNPQNMIIKRLLVAPPPVRPSVSMGSALKQEDDLTYSYMQIVKHNNILQAQIEKGANATTVNELRRCLQYYVATLMDNEISGQPQHKHKSGKPLKAVRSRLKGKEGRIRGNLMGKRVDFSARSVITPDPNLQLDQLGVPMAIAQNITVPVTVTPQNIDDMRRLVVNGPNVYPGAKYIIRHDQRQIDLGMIQNRCDAHIEPGYKVERHLRDDDLVLFNRQPSLHKMSIMGHRAKILPFSTFRLNLSVTTPYNADFDGDEMNMFVPQSFESLAEVKEIMAVPLQIVSPQSNKPVMGIVQDALLGIMRFTRRDTFVDKLTAMNLMMWIGGDKQLPTPAVLRPQPLWTGKQILSLVIPDVNLVKVFDQREQNWCPAKEGPVLIQRGQLVTGYLNKATAGSSSGGLIHVIFKERGPAEAANFLSHAQNVVNQWLAQSGFTVSVQDAIASKETLKSIEQTLDLFKRKVQRIIDKAERGRLKTQPGKNMMESFEFLVNNKLNQARDEAGQLAFKDLDPNNKIQNMVLAGSKGTNINISQIMGCVGQQNVEGKRIPFGFRERSLPHFTKFDYGPESRGFVKSNYISGLDPSEFFFHAMGGREGLIDTAVKTSETGYIQRRLMKALEDVTVKYDATVRNSADQVVQFLYGEDGMAGEHIEDMKIELIKMSNAEVEDKYNLIPQRCSASQAAERMKRFMDEAVVEQIFDNPKYQLKLMKEKTQILKDRDDLRSKILKHGDDQLHLPVNLSRVFFNCAQQFNLRKHRVTDLDPLTVRKKVKQMINGLSVFPGRKDLDESYFKEANENSTRLTKIYLRSELSTKRIIEQERMTRDSFTWLLGEIKSRFESALVHPGEMVGSIAAHSIGEPATQMTLNTFHFAGVSSKNVTLGVPRLKEVINVAKNIKTPMVQIYLDDRKSEEAVMKVQSQIEHTTLGHLVTSSEIFYDSDPVKTIIKEDVVLVDLYNEVPEIQDPRNAVSPWVLRLKLDTKRVISRAIDMSFISNKINDLFQDQISVMASDNNAENLVLRIRCRDLQDEEDESAVQFMKEIEDSLINDFTLKGIQEISKVYAKKYTEHEYDPKTGEFRQTSDNWMLETDGIALSKILAVDQVNYKRTISNDILEIQQVLGIEAVRMSLLSELRTVLSFYGIYVNYRHLATLCDVMCQRGKLTSITRHGINRMDTGPLRKCSFEETVEILLEASVFNEVDPLRGITESIIMGKTAPLGTGSFDVVLDQQVIEENAQANYDEDMIGEELTPIYEDDGYGILRYATTPYAGDTPQLGRMGYTSEYGRTPGGQSAYEGAFSPGQGIQSPYGGYSSPNPYQSPLSPTYRVNSPVYQANYQSPIYKTYSSPIYQPNSEGVISPYTNSPNNGYSGQAQSPNYSPNQNSIANSPFTPTGENAKGSNRVYSPSYLSSSKVGGGGHSIISSPSGTGPASPNYSPQQNPDFYGSHRSQNSPAYSPTNAGAGGVSNSSPHYSPTHYNYSMMSGYQPNTVKSNYSPSYSPTTPGFISQSPKYNTNRSPRYQVKSSHDDDIPGSSGLTNMYIPQSPVYISGSTGRSAGSGSVISSDNQSLTANANNNNGIQPTYDPNKE